MQTTTPQELKKDFKEQRKAYIGGSDIAAVMGQSRWKTALQLWAEKTGKITNEVTSEAAELGAELEDFVAKKFERKSGLKVRRDRRLFTLEGAPFCAANIDRRIVGTDELLECKTCSAWKAKEWEGEDVPVEYVLQVNWYLGIVGMSAGYIAVLIGGQKFTWKKLPFDQELFDKQVEAAKQFWTDYVLADVAPFASAGDSEALLELFPDARGEVLTIEAPDKQEYIDTALLHRLEVSKEIEAAQKEKDEIDAKIKQVIGETAGIQTDRFRITWTPQVRTTADTDKMKKDGIFEQYSKSSSTRVLRVTARKVEKNEAA